MKGRQVLAVVVLLLIVGLTAAAGPATAKSTKSDVDFWEVSCMVDPGIEWVEDGVLHGRGRLSTTILYANDPPQDPPVWEVVGSDTVIGNINLDLATGQGRLFGTWSLIYLPESLSGTFDGTWNGSIQFVPPPVFVIVYGRAVGHGTGELSGMKMKLKLVGDPNADPPPPYLLNPGLCPPGTEYAGVSHVTGFIHKPRGN